MTLQHVSVELREADVPAELGFWSLLGFERVEPPGRLASIAVWVQRAGTQVHLLFHDDPVVPTRGHAAVVAEQYDDAVARLERAGFECRPSTQDWGSPRCSVISPGGHRVEVMAFPPDA